MNRFYSILDDLLQQRLAKILVAKPLNWWRWHMDIIDQAQQNVLSRTFCIDCDVVIPKARLAIVKGCQRCVVCGLSRYC